MSVDIYTPFLECSGIIAASGWNGSIGFSF
jgi:hypothetical protein